MSTLKHYPPRGWTRSGTGWERRKPGSTNVMEWCADEVFHGGAATLGIERTRSAAADIRKRDEVISAPVTQPKVFVVSEAWDGFFKPQETDYFYGRMTVNSMDCVGQGTAPELAGGLFGYWQAGDVVVTEVTGRVRSGGNAQRNGRSQAQIDLDHLDWLESREAMRVFGWSLVGTWHSHSCLEEKKGHALPSPPDMRHWNSMQRASDSERPFLGCIIHPGHNRAYGWTDPMLACVLARGDKNTDYERANFVSVQVENHAKRCAKTWGGLNL